jgi:NADH-quinone oxidoreductase subunit G
VGAIEFIGRGSKMTVGVPFGAPIAESGCVGCGQCAAVCPTGAITIRDDTKAVWQAIDDPNVWTSVQVAPAVRTVIAQEFGMHESANAIGRIFAALRRMGFDRVYDTATGADLTVIEEGTELLKRLGDGTEHKTPLFSSCCPAWVQFAENEYPELLIDISTCKSPMQMFASVIKKTEERNGKKHTHVAVMPCTAKKFEASRKEFKTNGTPYVDFVITTEELIQMIRESGIVFDELLPEHADAPFTEASGGAVIFGVTGGVTEAVLRYISKDKSATEFMRIAYTGVRGLEGVKEALVKVEDRDVRIAVVSGLQNARDLIKRIKSGEHFDFVEVMSCRKGCIAGGGQPFAANEEKEQRGKNLYDRDKLAAFRSSDTNPVTQVLYNNGVLKESAHELLHVHYGA